MTKLTTEIKQLLEQADRIGLSPSPQSNVKARATLYSLMQSTQQFKNGQSIAGAKSTKIISLDFFPMIGMKTLLFRGLTQSHWTPLINAYGVNYVQKGGPGLVRVVDANTDEEAFLEPLSYRNTKVSIRCDCPSYRYNFAYYVDDQLNSLIGRLKPYVRKTPLTGPGSRPRANPEMIPGMCKHLVALTWKLQSVGFFR